VLVSIGASYDAAPSGRTHQAPEDVALMDSVPGFSVLVPGHPAEVGALLRGAVGTLEAGSTYIRLSTQANRETRPVWPGLQMVRSGRRGVVVAVGPMLSPVLDAVADLDVTVAYATTVRPFDDSGLLALAAAAPGAVVLVEPYLAGTSAFAVSSALASRPHRLLSLGVPRGELRRYGTPAEHAAFHGLDAGGIRRSVTRFLGLALRRDGGPGGAAARRRRGWVAAWWPAGVAAGGVLLGRKRSSAGWTGPGLASLTAGSGTVGC
jgi:transketolase